MADDINGTRVAGLALSALTLSNLITHRLLPAHAYVPANLALAGGLVALARASGHTIEDLGLDPRLLRRGARLGGSGSLMVGAAYAALLGSGRGRGLLFDRRFTGLGTGATLWRLLVHIPLGTVLAEEIVFRGVLPVVLRHPRHPGWAPPVIASALFGLWHLLPAHEQADANRIPMGPRMFGTVVLTAVAGGVLHRLRHRAGHLAAPVALHLATNGLGLLAVRIADRG